MASASKTAVAAVGFFQIIAQLPFDLLVAGNHTLSDTVTAIDRERFSAAIYQNDSDFTSVITVYSADTIG